MKIINASVKEVSDIVSLNAHVQEIHHNEFPDIFKPVSDDSSVHGFFKYLIDQESNSFLLAYIDATPVGCAWYAIEEKPEFPLKYARKQVYIHQIAVHEDFRRQRVGQSLFKKIEVQAKEQGIYHFELDSWAFNTEAHDFFNKLGFETYNINMWRKSKSVTT